MSSRNPIGSLVNSASNYRDNDWGTRGLSAIEPEQPANSALNALQMRKTHPKHMGCEVAAEQMFLKFERLLDAVPPGPMRNMDERRNLSWEYRLLRDYVNACHDGTAEQRAERARRLQRNYNRLDAIFERDRDGTRP